MYVQTNKILLFLSLFFLASCAVEKKTWKIGVVQEIFPDDAFDQDAYVAGFIQELFAAISTRQRVDILIEEYPEDLLMLQLKNGSIDASLSFFTETPVKKRSYTFSDPVLDIGSYLVFSEKISRKNPDLSDKIIGITAEKDAAVLLTKYPSAIIRMYPNDAALFADLSTGEIDALVAKKQTASRFINEFYIGQLWIADTPITSRALKLLIPKDRSSDLISLFNASLQSLKQQGAYASLEKKWGLSLR